MSMAAYSSQVQSELTDVAKTEVLRVQKGTNHALNFLLSLSKAVAPVESKVMSF